MSKEKKVEMIDFDLDRLNGKVSLDLGQLKEVRSADGRGYATYNLLMDGDAVAIAGAVGEDGKPSECVLQLLISDPNKKSKGSGKSGKKVL